MNNTLVAIVIGAITIYLGYNFYARRIDREVIQANPNKATPARMYMDGVDFVPTNRNILYGYHFKSIAAAGPIVGAITAGALWGWVPSIIWLVLGVVFMGWASDYSAIVVSVRNDGNSLSATAHRLIAPRTRQILLLFIFFYLLLVLFAFCYLGAILPIWRYAQPVNYIGFWITALTIVFGGLGAFLAFFLNRDLATFKLDGFIGFSGPPQVIASGALQPLWPMLFVTIACGAISGWHALIGSVGTARQIENETDMLPVGGGAMFSEFALGLLSLLAIATATTPKLGAPQFADGIGGFLSVFGIPVE